MLHHCAVSNAEEVCFSTEALEPYFSCSMVQINNIFKHKIISYLYQSVLNMCYVCSKETSHWKNSFEYPQQMLWLRNKKNRFFIPHFIQ